MIEFKSVSKFRMEHGRKKCILKDASFILPDRSRTVFLSSNPSDGMVFLRMISGIVPPDAGRIATTSKVSWIVGESIGMVNSLSARQNIKIVCGINGMGRSKCNRIVDMVTGFTGLGRHVDDPMQTYHKGMRERVFFALSLALRFDFFLVGNKIAVGTGDFRDKSRDAFLRIVGKSGVILGVPNLNLARKLCDSALVVGNGEAVLYDDLEKGIAAFRELRPEDKGKAARPPASAEGKRSVPKPSKSPPATATAKKQRRPGSAASAR